MKAKVLTTQVLVLLCLVSTAYAATVQVPGSWSPQGWWVNTGLNLSAGQTIHVTASGTWAPHPDFVCGPDGASGQWVDQFLNAYHYGGSGAHFGALIGYIGSAPPSVGLYSSLTEAQRLSYISRMVLLGSDVSVTLPASGILWLGMNDDAYGTDVSDNSGSVFATVDVVPEPSGALYLLPGVFCGMAGILRRKN